MILAQRYPRGVAEQLPCRQKQRMKSKQVLALVFTIIGAIALAFGVMAIFNKGQALGQNPWGVAIIGGIFFITGMGLLRTVNS